MAALRRNMRLSPADLSAPFGSVDRIYDQCAHRDGSQHCVESTRRICRADVVRPCRVVRDGRIRHSNPAGAAGGQSVAGRRAGGCRLDARCGVHRRIVIPLWVERILFRSCHSRVCRSAADPCQLIPDHRRRSGNPCALQGGNRQFSVRRSNLDLHPGSHHGGCRNADYVRGSTFAVRCLPHRHPRERRGRQGAWHRYVPNEGSRHDAVGSHRRRSRCRLPANLSLHRCTDCVWIDHVDRGATGPDHRRRRHAVGTAGGHAHPASDRGSQPSTW